MHLPFRIAIGFETILLLSGCATKPHMADMLIGDLPLVSGGIQSRAQTAENPKGLKGQDGQAGGGRKGSPAIPDFKPGRTVTIADIQGPGVIRHLWITVPPQEPPILRNSVLRFYWDDQIHPSVESPLSDFFGVAHGRTAPLESEFLIIAEGRGFNCYFPMPFRRRAVLTVSNENESAKDFSEFFPLFYQVDYTIGDRLPEPLGYFHAQFRRVPRTTLGQDYVILDNVRGQGRFMGAVIGLIDRYSHTGTWWGEGEVKIYMDGDKDYPTICGTGAEDYAGSAWGLGRFSSRFFGCPLNDPPYISFYRFHVLAPVYFTQDIKVTIQQIGNDGSPTPMDPQGPFKPFIDAGEYQKIRPGDGCYERVDDICSVAYWYQTLPTAPFGIFPDNALRRLDLLK